MPTASEKLLKILRLEKRNNFNNKAVIGGLEAYVENWLKESREQAQRPEQVALAEEIAKVLLDYGKMTHVGERQGLITYIEDRLTLRIEAAEKYRVLAPPPSELPKQTSKKPPDRRERLPENGIYPKPRRSRKERPAPPAHLFDELAKPLTQIKGVGEKMAEKLHRLGPQTIGDLLYLFPRRYDDYSQMVTLDRLEPYKSYTVVGTVKSVYERAGSKTGLKVTAVQVTDGTAKLELTFFNQPWLKRQLKVGMQLVFSGTTALFRGTLSMTNPLWEPVEQQELVTGGIVPIYPLTKGLSAHTMRKIMRKLLDEWAAKIPDIIPSSVLERAEQVDLGWALAQIHFPERPEYIAYARERLAFDELLILQLGVLANRTIWQAQPAHPLSVSDEWLAGFEAHLPFELTQAQKRAIQALRGDLSKNIPMNRLLQGDVGSGKTMVAIAALAIATQNGKQAALMAPTSILAEQHYQKISQLLPLIPGLEHKKVALLTGSVSASERQRIYAGLADGSLDVVIGTHAVIQAGVEIANLGVAVIDEQHRFGVEQRGALRGKGLNPHLLVMTATPIPRTLSLTRFADLDLSILDELPPGRTPIQTRLTEQHQRMRVYEFIEHKILQKGQQVYIIYPLIEESENIEAESAVDGYELISKTVYPRYKVGLLHGQMRPAEKEAVMGSFARNEIQVLVSTTVIEVGVDVPNATAIIIENAERFGLAQLHQLRGRVGRGELKSYCILLSDQDSVRLKALEESNDGFYLAELDFRERGAGDLLGLRQSGGQESALGPYMTLPLVELAQQESRTIYAEDPSLSLPEHQLIAWRTKTLRDERSDLS